MTPTQQERRIQALYDDANVSRRNLCERVVHLEADMEELRERVIKEHTYAYEAGYKEGSTNYELEHCPACNNVADLQDALAENAKLQEYITKLER